MPLAVCAPDKFRGSLTASEAAAAMAEGAADAGFETRELPLADGGEGTLDVLLAACGGERRHARVTGPDGAQVVAAWGLLPDGTAVVELAQASGLALLGTNDPIAATTRGTGELLVAAAGAGARRAILGVGGSAATDGGLGALDAVGWTLPIPVTVACDTTVGFLDAAPVYAPQKGATPDQVEALSRRLDALVDRYRAETGVDVTELVGAGAAGGTAGGFAAIGAELTWGFEVVAEACGLNAAVRDASVVVTGEGRVDVTSGTGKVVGGVLAAASRFHRPSFVVAGAIAELPVPLPGDPRLAALCDLGVDDTFGDAAVLVRRVTRDLLGTA